MITFIIKKDYVLQIKEIVVIFTEKKSISF